MKNLFSLTLILSLLTSCLPTEVSPVSIPATLTANLPTALPAPAVVPRIWWRDAIFYEIFVRSFNDSNSDGIGDFNGITQRLDYLQSLGITAIWLMPIHPSPSYHGYDVLNYYGVNSQYGSLDDFKNLLRQSHSRGIRIILDLVLNHTSSQHPWFTDANSNPKSEYRDWYLWSDTSNSNKWYQGKSGFYYAYFGDGMPDLNYINPDVTRQMEKISSFWLNTIGVDGFPIDAAKHLLEEGNKTDNTGGTHTWFKNYQSFIKTEKQDSYTVGEVGGADALIAKSYSGQMDQIFNFELASAIVNSARGEANSSITSAFKFAIKDMPNGNYATFLTNHDQNRVMSVLNNEVGKAKVAASILLTAPGTPFIYYGEEIGMVGQKPDENIRLPMQWANDPANAGFTTGIPWRTPSQNTITMNFASEDKDSNSLLNHYRALISLRKQFPALRTGSITLLDTNNSHIYATVRKENQEIILTLINLSKEPVGEYQLQLTERILENGSYSANPIFGTGEFAALQVTNETFNSYKPIPEIPPFRNYIAAFKTLTKSRSSTNKA